MALGDNLGSLGSLGRAASGVQSFRSLIKGDVAGALSGGLFGSSGIFGGGGLFGGGRSERDIRLSALTIPDILKEQGIKIRGAKGGSFGSFRDAAVPLEQQIRSISPAIRNVAKQFEDLGLPDYSKEIFLEEHRLSRTPSGHADALRINQSKINLIKNSLDALALFRSNPEFVKNAEIVAKQKAEIARRKEEKGPDRPRKPKDDNLKRTILRVASQFALRPPLKKPRVRTSGFVSSGGGGFSDISELSQEADKIIPSGFISKQATTQNRALALDRIR